MRETEENLDEGAESLTSYLTNTNFFSIFSLTALYSHGVGTDGIFVLVRVQVFLLLFVSMMKVVG